MKKALFVLSLVGLWLWLTPVEAQTEAESCLWSPGHAA